MGDALPPTPPPPIFYPLALFLSSWVLSQWEFVICYLVIYMIRELRLARSSP